MRPPIVDAHHHFWSIVRGDYGWLTPEVGAIYRDFLPHDLEPYRLEANVGSTVLVQAAPTEAETHYLLELAARTTDVKAVVGWVDLLARDAPQRLVQLKEHPLFRGVRPMLQDLSDDAWILSDDLTPAVQALVDLDLTFDALVKPVHLPALRRFLERHPDLRAVVDHGAKPPLRAGPLGAWKRDIATVAKATNVFCKLSGLVNEASSSWQSADLQAPIDHLLECFGPGRLMWGSDWPVVESAGGYARWLHAARHCTRHLSLDDRDRIFRRNASTFYRLAPGAA